MNPQPKGTLLEIVETQESLDSIGGLDVLKDWLLKRRHAFTQRAVAYALPPLKGLLILGLAGTGKSLSAKVAARVFGVPLLKLDAGRLYGGLVGQTEANLRAVMQTAEAIAPCCLWLDELEKGLAGSHSSGATDGGTSARVLGSWLSWMQEKTAPVFVVATANDVSRLPPELLRAGRWDALFFVDLPTPAEREAIWTIQIRKHGRQPADFDTVQLARASDGLTGSEIEAVFVEALYDAFARDTEPTDLDLARVLTHFVPLSKTMAEPVHALRAWAKGRGRPATTPPVQRAHRQLAVRSAPDRHERNLPPQRSFLLAVSRLNHQPIDRDQRLGAEIAGTTMRCLPTPPSLSQGFGTMARSVNSASATTPRSQSDSSHGDCSRSQDCLRTAPSETPVWSHPYFFQGAKSPCFSS